MLEGILLPSNMAAKTSFCLYLVKRLLVSLRCAANVTTSSFQHFPWSFSAHFGHVTSYQLTHFKKMAQVWKTKSLLFCSRYDPLIVFPRKNHITFIFIKTMLHDLLVQMAYTAPMASKSPQPSHEPPFQAPIWWNSGRNQNKGWEGGKTLNELLHRPLHKHSMKNSLILPVYKLKLPCTMWACSYGIVC